MDGLLIKINYEFLTELQKRGLIPSAIRVKLLSRDSRLNSISLLQYSDITSYLNANQQILNDNKYLCYAGTFMVIENITLSNTNLSFANSYKWQNITDRRKFTKNVNYDIKRKDIYDNQLERYMSLYYSLFNTYTKNINNAISTRLNSYVDSCYVDAGYVSPNSDPIK